MAGTTSSTMAFSRNPYTWAMATTGELPADTVARPNIFMGFSAVDGGAGYLCAYDSDEVAVGR